MKKETLCKECCNTIKTTICDVCGMDLLPGRIRELGREILHFPGNPITLDMDGTYDFCSLKCLQDFINDEIKKGIQ